MPYIEKIVRPFQTNVTTPPRRLLTDEPPESKPNVILRYGESGSGITTSGSYSLSFTTYADKKDREQSGKRNTTKKRIKNPEDESQYLDVEMIDKLETKRGKGPTYQKTQRFYDNKDPEEG